MRQYWIAKKDKKKISLYPYVKNQKIDFAIIEQRSKKWHLVYPEGEGNVSDQFDPEEGTVSRFVVKCPVCETVIDDKTTRKLFIGGK